jgi:hypothetical protein
MSIKMKKRDLFIAYSIVIIGLSGLFGGIVSCQNGLTSDVESLAIPPKLPRAAIVSGGGAESGSAENSITNYRFSLNWKYENTVLPASWSPEDPVIQDSIRDVLVEWEQFEKYTDPKPCDEADSSNPKYDVIILGGMGGQVLENDNGTNLVLRRCWPLNLTQQGTAPTRADWDASFDERVAEFKQTVKDIKAMMAALEKSPLFDVEVDGELILAQVHKLMGEYIAFPPDPENHTYTAREKWVEPTDLAADGSERWKFIYDPAQTGPLYEYYFGYAPEKMDYEKPDGKLPFPAD